MFVVSGSCDHVFMVTRAKEPTLLTEQGLTYDDWRRSCRTKSSMIVSMGNLYDLAAHQLILKS